MSIAGQSFSSAAADAAYVTLGVGGIASLFNGGFTIAVLGRTTNDNAGWFGGFQSAVGGTDRGGLLFSGTKLYSRNDFSSGYGSGLNDNVWRWYVISKPAGSAHYRYHYADLATLTWSHGESVGSANQPDTGVSGVFTLGYFVYGLGFETIDIAAAAVWTSNLSDSAIQAACTQTASALAAGSPSAGWLLPEAEVGTAGSIVDFTGGGADETARQFLAASPDPVDFDFGTGPIHFWTEGSPSAAGATKFTDGSDPGIVTSTNMTFNVDGQIRAIRFGGHGATPSAVSVQGGIYAVGGGSPLATTTIVTETGADGDWITVPLTTPLNVTAGTSRRIALWSSRTTSKAPYWAKSGYFDGGPVTHGDITADQGYFIDNVSGLTYPNTSFGNAAYFVDVVFEPAPPDAFVLATTVSLTATGEVSREVLWTTASPGNPDPVQTGGIVTGTGVLFGAEPDQPYVASIWSEDGHYVSTINGFLSTHVGELGTLYAWAQNEPITSVAPDWGTMVNGVFTDSADVLPTTGIANNYFVSPIYDGANGTVKGVRFFTSTTVSGNYRASLWKLDSGTQATGTRVASKTFTAADIAGGGQFQTVLFDTPYVLGAAGLSSTAALSLTATLTSSGSADKLASANLASTVTLTAQGVVGAVANAAVQVTAAISATVTQGDQIGSSVPLAASIVATAVVGRPAGANLALGASIAATGSTGVAQSASIALGFATTSTGAIDFVEPPQPPADAQLSATYTVALDFAHDVGLENDYEVTLAWLP